MTKGLIEKLDALYQNRMPDDDYTLGYLGGLYAAKDIIRQHFASPELVHLIYIKCSEAIEGDVIEHYRLASDEWETVAKAAIEAAMGDASHEGAGGQGLNAALQPSPASLQIDRLKRQVDVLREALEQSIYQAEFIHVALEAPAKKNLVCASLRTWFGGIIRNCKKALAAAEQIGKE